MDVIELWRYIGALLLVIGLIGLAAYGARRFGLPGLVKPDQKRRLRVVETVIVSPRQRVCLIRRDDVEHLVLIGPEGSSVIEQNIPAPPEPYWDEEGLPEEPAPPSVPPPAARNNSTPYPAPAKAPQKTESLS